MRACDGASFLAFTTTQGPFRLQGGYYAFVAIDSDSGASNHADVTSVGPDGSTAITWIKGPNGTLTNPQYGYLPAGDYSVTVTGTLAGCDAVLTRVPFD